MPEAAKDYNAKHIENHHNPSKMLKTISVVFVRATMRTSLPLIEQEGKQITDKEEVASAFNENFITLGQSCKSTKRCSRTDFVPIAII